VTDPQRFDQQVGRLRRKDSAFSFAFVPKRANKHARNRLQKFADWLQVKRGIETQLCIRVRKEGEVLLAHAWLEKGGEVVNDSPLTTAAYARMV
jgi:hypothetical protein